MSRRFKYRTRRQQPRVPWHRILIAPIFILLGLVAVLLWRDQNRPAAALEVAGRPSLKANQETVDLGDVRLGQTVEASFELANVGDQSLRFSESPYIEVVEGCWPPTPTIGSMVLSPGQRTIVRMQFMMHGDMGGFHNFRVHLPNNDPTQPDRTFTVLSNWVP
jgi:hypothetical protein